MALIRRTEMPGVWDPFRIMLEMMGDQPVREPYPEQAAGFVPSFEVFERADGFVFMGDLPGVKQADLDITLTENRLTITGKRIAEEHKEGEKLYAMERGYGSFTRTFSLPEGVDGEHVRAELKDGVLTLVIPKKPEVLPRKIQVKLGTETEKH